MEILGTYWFKGGGIVKALTEQSEVKYFIWAAGGCNYTDSDTVDPQFILDWGNNFPNEVGDAVFRAKKGNSVWR